jgi:c-di-GMP-binding flagellar brake protein YcgR
MVGKSPLISSEKRRRKRYRYENSILCYKIVAENKNDIAPFRIVLDDISYSGMGITTQKKLAEGSMLEFNLNNRFDIRRMKFRVKWEKHCDDGYKYGLEFLELTANDIYFINDIIEDIKKKGNKKKK